jgi:tetratricopeptide (TPR) repeat protein
MAGDRVQVLAAAAAHEREGRLDDAERLYRALLAENGEDVEALVHLGSLKIAQGDASEGELLIRRACARDGASAADHVRLAAAFLALRRHDDAIAESRKALSMDPRLAAAHIAQGSAFHVQRDHDQAIASYKAALAIEPDLTVAHYNIAAALQAQGRHQEAVASYQLALAADPDVVEAQYGLGTSLVALGRDSDAIGSFERALDGDPDFVEAALALGRLLNSAGRHEEATARFRQALEVDPDYAEALVGLAKASLALGRQEEAFAAFETALRLHPEDPSILIDFGFALTNAAKADRAVAHYRKAASLVPDNAEILANLGGVLIQSGQIEEARAIYERALALKPSAAAPYAALLAMRPAMAADPILLGAERLLGDREDIAERDVIRLHFALGKAYSDIGDHARAFEHLRSANELKRRSLKYDEIKTLGQLEEIERVFTPQLMKRVGSCGDPSPVPIFIVGYPRSGSTLTEQILASHPSVIAGGERHDFTAAIDRYCPRFPDQVPSLADETLRQLGAGYVARLTHDAPGAFRVTDKMLGNFTYIGLIRLALPNAHIVHVNRDPVDTCWSCFSNSFEGDSVPFTYDLGELGRSYCAYTEMMEHWRRVLPAESILEVTYEVLVANFEYEARRIVAHCGLQWDDACLAFYKSERVVRTASAVQVRQPIYQSSIGRAKAFGGRLQPLLDALG